MSKTIFAGYDATVYLEQFVEDNVFLYKLDNIDSISGGKPHGSSRVYGTIGVIQFAGEDIVASLGAEISEESGLPTFRHKTNLWVVQTRKDLTMIQGYKDVTIVGYNVAISAGDLGNVSGFNFHAQGYLFPTNLKDFNDSNLLLIKLAVAKMEDAIGDSIDDNIFCSSQNDLDSVACDDEEEYISPQKWARDPLADFSDEEKELYFCDTGSGEFDGMCEPRTPRGEEEWFEINAVTYEHVMDLMYHIIEDGGADFTRIALFDTEDAVDGEEIEAFEEIYVYEENVDEVAEYVMDLLTTEAPDLKMAMILTNLD
jgi:hypothetical protein